MLKRSNPISVTAVFDIGKTNKKFLLFDKDFEVVYDEHSSMEREIIEDDDGYRSENLSYLVGWIKQQLLSVLQDDDFKIDKLNFTTYGASLVHLDEEGQIATHFYNYLKPYPDQLLEQFYDTYGGKEQFALETASPPMGMLNSGLQLYWLKYKKPDKFSRIKQTLHFPQYLSAIFTGAYISEYTSLGCHTGLWDFEENNYHRWVEEEEMEGLLPELQLTTNTMQAEIKNAQVETGVGIHDSSAALIPYLLAMDDPFMLLSTGTWNITLNPFNKTPLSFEELQRDCLCYMNMNGDQVKASRAFLGHEYSHQKKKLDAYFNRDVDGEEVSPDASVLNELIQADNNKKKLKLETAHSSGPFRHENPEEWKVDQFETYKVAYHQLMLDLVAIQAESIKLAQGTEAIDKIIVTGGFGRNDFFVRLLASYFSDKKIYTDSLSHASALGAATIINEESAPKKLKELMALQQHSPLAGIGLNEYCWNEDFSEKPL